MKTTTNSAETKTNPNQENASPGSFPKSCEVTKPERLALNIHEILVPTDFSEHSKKALRHAVSIAEHFGAKITILHVVEPPVTSYPYAGYPFDPEPVEAGEFLPWVKIAAKQMCQEENINPQLVRQTLIKVGIPHQEITNVSADLKTDLIVIATQGRTGLAHILLGSTTERVVRHAPCAVLVVRENQREFVPACSSR